MASIKKNLIYSILLTTSSYIMSLVVFPYASRILGPSSLGIVGFMEGTVGVFTLLTTMGINFLGIREIARSRHDSQAISSVYTNLITLLLIFTIVGVCGFIICASLIPNLRQHPQLIALGILSIIAQVFLIEWFYKGLENFKYITLRNIAVKVIYIISIFFLIKSPSDYLIYFALIVATYSLNATINIIYARKFVHFSFRYLNLKAYLKPYISIGIYTVLASLYITFNPMFLGATTNDIQVGYYSVSIKVFTIIFSSFTAITTVLMPRMSVLTANNEIEKLKENSYRTINIFTILATPLTILGIYYSPQIVNIISGNAYAGAILPMQILMPLLFINGYAQILNVQILMTINQDKTILKNSKIVCAILILLNIALVPFFGAIGSAIVWTTCELAMLILSQVATTRLVNVRFYFRPIISSIITSIPGMAIIVAISYLPLNQYIQAIIGCIVFLLM